MAGPGGQVAVSRPADIDKAYLSAIYIQLMALHCMYRLRRIMGLCILAKKHSKPCDTSSRCQHDLALSAFVYYIYITVYSPSYIVIPPCGHSHCWGPDGHICHVFTSIKLGSPPKTMLMRPAAGPRMIPRRAGIRQEGAGQAHDDKVRDRHMTICSSCSSVMTASNVCCHACHVRTTQFPVHMLQHMAEIDRSNT